MTQLRFARDSADRATLLGHLRLCDAGFLPPLSERVDLAEYAGRLDTLATRFEAWSGDELVGLVAVYCNAPDGSVAFVTNVSVLPGHQQQGIARRLMQDAVAFLRDLGFVRLQLKVAEPADAALNLYRSLGFEAIARDGASLTLQLDLKGELP